MGQACQIRRANLDRHVPPTGFLTLPIAPKMYFQLISSVRAYSPMLLCFRQAGLSQGVTTIRLVSLASKQDGVLRR